MCVGGGLTGVLFTSFNRCQPVKVGTDAGREQSVSPHPRSTDVSVDILRAIWNRIQALTGISGVRTIW